MLREALYVKDIIEAGVAIQRFLENTTRGEFDESDLLRSAVLHKLTIIGEGAARLPQELRDRYPGTNWRAITRFRNIIVHAYFSIDWEIIWQTVESDLPALLEEARRIAATEFPDLVIGDAPGDNIG
jgi:uncharacterized protein with HEPN domain